MDEKTFTFHINDLYYAVNMSCSCGGGGMPDCCPACEVWHRLTDNGRLWYEHGEYLRARRMKINGEEVE